MFKSYKDIFSQRADSYHQAMSECPQARALEFKNTIEQVHIPVGSKICDLPSGGGYLWPYLPDNDLHFTAVEVSNYFFQNCLEDQHRERVLSELHKVALPDGSFDIVFSVTGLHHIEDRGAVYAEIFRLLKPGGVAVIAEVKQASPVAYFLNEYVHQYSSMGHEGLFLDAADIRLIEKAGFNINKNKYIEYGWWFNTVKEMTRFCRLLFALDKVDDESLEQGIKHYLGYESHVDGIEMAWGLQFITLSKNK
jgi:ubiquinone/menaquinone biosynthesis C-methylase UbiE